MKNRLVMDDTLLDDLYQVKSFDSQNIETQLNIGKITEKDKFLAAKQILLGLAVLYVLTVVAYLYRPSDGNKLLDICTTSFPPLATLILVAYFREKH
jgi:hypothetical protein